MEQHYGFFRSVALTIAIGVWVIVLQNAGIIPQISPQKFQQVEAIEVTGEVDVMNTVFIRGSVDANLESINGYAKFYKDPRTGEFYVIPVTDPYE